MRALVEAEQASILCLQVEPPFVTLDVCFAVAMMSARRHHVSQKAIACDTYCT